MSTNDRQRKADRRASDQKKKIRDLTPRGTAEGEDVEVKGGDKGTGKAQFHDLSFTHTIDKASP